MSDAPTITADATPMRPAMQPIAPAWHTAGVLALLLGIVMLSMHTRGAAPAGHASHRLLGYSVSMASEWLIVGFIWLGGRWGVASLRNLAGSFAPGWRPILRDLGLAVAFLFSSNIILGFLSFLAARLGHPSQGGYLKNLLPRGPLEIAAFLLLALTAGICEETIFRGYLQRQFTAWTRSAAAGILAQGLVFGCAHAYQGSTMIFIIAVYGCLFGLLALWRKSLRPGMIAHFLQDGIGGILLARQLLK